MLIIILSTGSIGRCENVTFTNGMSVNASTLYYGSSCSVNDGLPSSTTYGVTRGIVTLGLDWGILDYNASYIITTDFIAEFVVNIKGWNPTVATPTGLNYTTNVTETLKVIYHPKQNVIEIDKGLYTFKNVRQLQATVTAIKINGVPVTATTTQLPQILKLTTDLEIERYKTMSTGTAPTPTITAIGNDQIKVTWSAITGAEDYDVEWLWVDAMAPQNYDFTNNASRATIPASLGLSYILPISYPNGTIIVRLRARGRDLTIAPDFSRHTFTIWSITSGTVGSVAAGAKYVISTGFEKKYNWQFTTTFSEQGKRQDVMKYYDGTLRNRQSIMRLNVLDTAALVGETFYDHIGRPSVQVLPVPHVGTDTAYNHLRYRLLFNRDIHNNQFTYNDFDTNAANSCSNLVVNPMSDDYGAEYYYSANNPLINSTYGNVANYLPKSNGFPYTHVEYMPDNTNRIRRQSGVGITHRVTGIDDGGTSYTGKETKYYYGTPFQVQLDRLFGSEVGRYKHYKKNLVVDANGQISVSYLDPYGRVVATALAGDTTTTPNLIPLSSSNSSATLSCNLLDSMQIDYNNMSVVSTATHLVTSPGIHSFTYTVATPVYKNCLPAGWCFDCVYDLTISIKDECGLELVPETLRTHTVGNINTICDSITFTLPPNPLAVTFSNPGNYVITKILTVNEEALDYYTQMFLDSSTCILPLDSFIADAMNDIDTTECYGGCTECLDRLGDYSEHNDTTYRYTAGYEYMTLAEYNHAKEICNAMCETPTPCSILYKQILADVSPGGQYMEYDLSGTTYTVDDTLSLLNMSYGALGNYADLTGYEDPDGNVSEITIGSNTYYPQNLPVDKFLQHWQESWAENLAPLHPEYCYYEECASHEDSYIYDNNMLFTSTFEAARDSGFLNPIGSNTDTVPFHIEHKDPFFAPYSGGLFTVMSIKLDDYAGSDTTAWEMVTHLQNTNNNSYSGNGDCWTDYDWSLFRTMYLSSKQEILQGIYEGLSCPDWNGYTGNAFGRGIKTPRFIFDTFGSLGDENLTGNDINIDDNSSPQDIQDEALAQMEGYCDTICTSYADGWMFSLAGCGMSDPDSVEIRMRLIEACRGNCDQDNPLGGVEQEQVTDILEDVLGPSYMSASCNPLDIIQPVAFGHTAFGMVEMDSCACDKVLNAHLQYDTLSATGGLPVGICSEQDMFTYLYGPDANSVNFDQLECYCLQQGYIINDTIVTSTSSGPVTTIVAPNCDMYIDYYTSQQAYNPTGFLTTLMDIFNYHWALDSCTADTFPVSGLGTLGDDISDNFTDYIVDVEYIMPLGYYVKNVNFTFLGPCENEFHMTVSYDCDYSDGCIADENYELLYIDTVTQDSIQSGCELDSNWYSPQGNGLYATIYTFNSLAIHQLWVRRYIWTDFFETDSLPICGITPTMYVPYSLACEQCFDCEMVYNWLGESDLEYSSITLELYEDSLYSEWQQVYTDNFNQTFNQNFTNYQIFNFLQQCVSSEEYDTLQLCYEPMFTVTHDPHQECVDFLIETALSNAESNYHAYIDSVTAAFRQAYISKCLGAFETFDMEYTEREFHYTLYYYDQAGNLIKTVPPNGVNILTASASLDSVENYRNHIISTRVIPRHKLITNYKYNTLNQPSAQRTPDGGLTTYWYDIMGRLVVSQNDQQQNSGYYSYTKYDDLGRIIEVGQVQRSDTAMTHAHSANATYLANWISAGTKTQVTCTYYDLPRTALNAPFTANTQKNLRNRISYTTFEETYNSSDTIYDVATHYSYDIHGNVKELVQETKTLQTQNARFKLVQYEYDLISGKVLEVKYQKEQKDEFYHKYEYTHDNKLTKVKTSRNYVQWDVDASYKYYIYGAVARLELGDNKVQGVDYAYTIHGWIKGSNSNTLNSKRDMGKDGYLPTGIGVGSNPHRTFCVDVASYSLGYYRATDGSTVSDYQSIGTFATANFFLASVDTLSNVISTNQKSLFNGNISYMVTTIPNCSTFTATNAFVPDPLGTVYRYDQLNRIKQMLAYSDIANVNSLNRWGSTSTNNGKTYRNDFTYDANGNLTKLSRKGDQTGSNLLMDSLTYAYATGGAGYYNSQTLNRLSSITELQTTAARYSGDIDNNSTYGYDDIGNLISDSGEQINNIEWTVYGKVKKVTRSTGSTKPDLEFKYNSSGQRYLKITKPRNSSGVLRQTKWTYTYYIYDAGGNLLSSYTLNYSPISGSTYHESVKINNYSMYGSSRLGTKEDTLTLNKRSLVISSWYSDSTMNSFTPSNITLPARDTLRMFRATGYKEYEVNNHLGNVMATITDRKIPIGAGAVFLDTIVTHFVADINTLTDYYPFGAQMPGRYLAATPCSTFIKTITNTVVDEKFASGVGGFTATGGSTVANSGISQKLRITKASCAPGVSCNNWGAIRTFAHINAVVYTVTFDLDLGTCGAPTIGVRIKNPGGSTIVTNTYTTAGTKTFTFTATATGNGTIEFFMSSLSAPCNFLIDNVKITYESQDAVQECGTGSDFYPYGHNGQMKDDEIYGEANAYTAEFWEYDPRIARRWNLDPQDVPAESPYACFRNSPVSISDVNGDEPEGKDEKDGSDTEQDENNKLSEPVVIGANNLFSGGGINIKAGALFSDNPPNDYTKPRLVITDYTYTINTRKIMSDNGQNGQNATKTRRIYISKNSLISVWQGTDEGTLQVEGTNKRTRKSVTGSGPDYEITKTGWYKVTVTDVGGAGYDIVRTKRRENVHKWAFVEGPGQSKLPITNASQYGTRGILVKYNFKTRTVLPGTKGDKLGSETFGGYDGDRKSIRKRFKGNLKTEFERWN